MFSFRFRSRTVTRLTAAGLSIAVLGVGAQSFAGNNDDPIAVNGSLIVTTGVTFDETVLVKSIPARGFTPSQGAGNAADLVADEDSACLSAGAGSGGGATFVSAPLELPNSSLIKRVVLYGLDNSVNDMNVKLYRYTFTSQAAPPAGGSYTREFTEVAAFGTSGASPDPTVVSSGELEERTGTGGVDPELQSAPHRFHTLEVGLSNGAAGNHAFCGIEVHYQVPTSSADPGTVFHPIDPIRAFDSRIASYASSGPLTPDGEKIISVANGYDAAGVAIPEQADSVPSGASAVTYNVTIAGANGGNFVALTAGNASGFTASSINYSSGSNIANAGTVTISSDRTIKVWGGNGPGSSQVIIDITGYYSVPNPPPNMGN